jgi:hypothetical protein
LWTGRPKPGSRSPAARAGAAVRLHPLPRPVEQARALLGGPQQDRPRAQDARRHSALQRARVGRERHPRRDVGRHHAVLGDPHQQQVEEEALVVAGLRAGEQQVEVVGEGQ